MKMCILLHENLNHLACRVSLNLEMLALLP